MALLHHNSVIKICTE